MTKSKLELLLWDSHDKSRMKRWFDAADTIASVICLRDQRLNCVILLRKNTAEIILSEIIFRFVLSAMQRPRLISPSSRRQKNSEAELRSHLDKCFAKYDVSAKANVEREKADSFISEWLSNHAASLGKNLGCFLN